VRIACCVAAVAAVVLTPSAGAACLAAGPPLGAAHDGAWRARFVGPTAVLAHPGWGTREVVSPTPGSPLSMSWGSVVAGRSRNGRCYVAVQLATRPNGHRGWVDSDRVQLAWTPWRIEINRALRRATVVRAGAVARSFPVVVGKPSTPTPAGRFAVLGATPNDPATFDGSWVVTLTAESDALREFGGGPGRIGLHGRGGASLADPLGTAASHGCIRFDNAAIGWIVRTIGPANLPGIPVVVH
jgi:lipoprotein-anchoring transpeptidase ErfK/SrfK